MLPWPTRRSIFLRNCVVAHRKLLYLLSRFLRFSQNVPVAPVALRFLCLQKSIEIVNVLKTNRKPMILDHFFERILCDRLRFFLSRLGAFASRSWVLVATSVSRGCFGRFFFNELGVQRSERYFDFGALRVSLLDFEIRWDLGSPSCWLGSFCRRDLGVQRSAWDFLRGGVPMDVRGPTSGHLQVKYRGRCSIHPVVPFCRRKSEFLIYLNGWAGKARGRVKAGYWKLENEKKIHETEKPAL